MAQLLRRHLSGRPTRANFRTGTLTVCTMVPMRSVPHRWSASSASTTPSSPSGAVDGDDVLARDPMTGERDVRSEDRQLLLDAVCAATETLVITYAGADEYSGQLRPPAVPLAELLDAFDATTAEPVREHITVRHPLQPFDPPQCAIRALTPRRPDTPFSFDPTVQRAATVAAGHREEPPGFVARPLPAPDAADVSLAELTAFFRDPVRGSSGRWTTPCPPRWTVSTMRSRSRSTPFRSGPSGTGCCATSWAASARTAR